MGEPGFRPRSRRSAQSSLRNYLRNYSPKKQRKEGSYYTPRIIAHMMVGAAFHALRRDGNAHEARILDPAAGAGIFLITAFRQLVAERGGMIKSVRNRNTAGNPVPANYWLRH